MTALDLEATTISDEELAALPVLEKVTRVVVNSCHALKTLTGLSRLPNLKTLDAYDCALDSLEGLRGLTNLESLGLGATDFGLLPKAAQVDALSTLSGLVRLDLIEAGGDFRRVLPLPSLESLFLSNTHIDDSGLARCPKLRELHYWNPLDAENVDFMASLHQLTVLDLSGWLRLGNLDGLRDLAALQSLRLRDCPALGIERPNETSLSSRAQVQAFVDAHAK